jgi:Ring finger domain
MSLERSLECQICGVEPWGTGTGCGHLFGADCIDQWLEENSAWMENDDGSLMSYSSSLIACPAR